MRALSGTWELDGELVSLVAEPDTGVLVALTTRGYKMNPMKVISRGSKMDGVKTLGDAQTA